MRACTCRVFVCVCVCVRVCVQIVTRTPADDAVDGVTMFSITFAFNCGKGNMVNKAGCMA